MLTDTHCHLDMIPDPKIALLRAKEAGVGTIINVGTSIDASRQSIEIAEETDSVDVYATCGIHAQEGPKDIKKYGSLDKCIDELRNMTGRHSEFISESGSNRSRNKFGMTQVSVQDDKKRVVAIGECGMDFFLEKTNQGPATSDDEKKDQRELFEAQVKLAMELDLPLIIHCRNAWEETFDTISKIKDQKSKLRGVFHSWTGTLEQAKRALDLGFYISFSGIVTFKNAGEIPEVAKMVPEDRILVETDAPFLTPRRSSPILKFQGANETNEPKNVRITAQFLADLRGVSLDEISGITTGNAKRLFRI
ncbi:TatD family hydrolase [Candidatus Curtissbacteria bacterium]|nr:TatD family hydrolase [Candidatus Curtissbacteria bacterium]